MTNSYWLRIRVSTLIIGLPAALLGTEVAWGPWFVPNSSTLSNKTVTADIQCTTSLNLSDCTRWRFICCNRKIAKSTVSAFPPDCNLLARSKRECLSLAFGRVRHFEKASTSQGFVGLRWKWRTGPRPGQEFDKFEVSMNSRFRWIQKFDEFDSSLNARVQRI